MLRLDATAKARRFYVRRRDLLREHRLQPRDLRRIDPSIDFTKTSPSITIKEDVLLLNLGGVRCGPGPGGVGWGWGVRGPCMRAWVGEGWAGRTTQQAWAQNNTTQHTAGRQV